jgi:uncharacterized protein (DUF58 family)
MKYGSGRLNNLHYGKMMAACLAYLILHQRDAAALALFDTSVREFTARSDHPGSLPPLLAKLAALEPRAQTHIGAVLHDTARHIRRKGIVIVISDFFDDEQRVLDGLQHLRFDGHEVVLFHVLDPYELEFPFLGSVEFEGLEGIPSILTRPSEIRTSYRRELEAFRSRLREGCEKNHCHYMLVNTAHPLHEVLSGYLAFRLRTTTH